MGLNTNISWTQTILKDGTIIPGHTWNPWRGCHKISDGCKYCYMFRDMKKYKLDPNTVVRASNKTFNSPLNWVGKIPDESKIFTCSWSDFFIEEADPWRDEAWKIIKNTPFTYLILTKRPERIIASLPDDWGFMGYENVWLLVTTENQKAYDKRWPILFDIPAVIKGISAEPLLGPIDLFSSGGHMVDWVITGGESMSNRKMDPKWVIDIADYCYGYGIPMFHKQNGGKTRINGVWGGDTIEKSWHEFPGE